jgi:membrane-associated protease RseP (regulator of RpoE activity)
MPVITALAVFLVVGSLAVLASNATARQDVSSVGPQANLLIPGINPYLPIGEGLLGLFVTIVIHEAGHGIVARVYNIRVDSTGIVLLLGIPIGAFVNIEREELSKATLRQKSAVLTAGPLNNMILSIVSLVGIYFIVSSLTPIISSTSPQYGAAVVSVRQGGPAYSIGITPNSIIQSVNGMQVRELQNLTSYLQSNCGNTVSIQWIDGSGKTITRSVQLPPKDDTGPCLIGVGISPVANPQVVLDRYKAAFSQNPLALLLPPTINEGAVPYSSLMGAKYISPLGSLFVPVSNILFWMWFINFNVGIFNALPIGPLDGGQLYSSVIQSRTKSPTLARNASQLLTYLTAGVVLASLLIPYIDRLPALAGNFFK